MYWKKTKSDARQYNIYDYKLFFCVNLPKNVFKNVKWNKADINIIKSINILFINICTYNINNAGYEAYKCAKYFDVLSIFWSYKFFKNLSECCFHFNIVNWKKYLEIKLMEDHQLSLLLRKLIEEILFA